MKKITFLNSCKNQKKKTKRWLGPLFCLIFVFTGQFGFSQDDDPTTYCIPAFITGCTTGGGIDDFIIQNTSINHIDSGCSDSAYGDFTDTESLQGSMHQGENYMFTATHNLDNQWISIWIDFNGNGDFEDSGELLFTSTTAGSATVASTGIITIPLTAPLSSATRLRVTSTYYFPPSTSCIPGGSYLGETHDYTVAILPPTDCPTPSAPNLTNITADSVDLGWTGTGTSFDIEYGALGFTQGSGTTITEVTTNPYTLSGLNPMTSYEFYVRQYCGIDDGYSFWTGPYSFKTLCGPVDTFFENFDSYSTGQIVPECWHRIVPGANTAQNISSVAPVASGNRHLRQVATNSNNTSIVVLPQVTNINAGTHWLRFKARINSGTGNLQVGYVTDITDADTFVEIQTLTIVNTVYVTGNATYTVVFPTTVPANARIAVRNPGISTSQHFWDDVYWEAVPSCLSPVPLTATNVTQTTVDLNWSGDGALFDIEYGSSGFIQGTGTIVANVASNTYTIPGLSPATTYEYYIRQDCGGGDESVWTGPFSFFTPCVPVDTITENFDSYAPDYIVPDCWDRIISGANIAQTITTTPPVASGNQHIRQYSASPSDQTIVVLPPITNINAGTHWLRFKARVHSVTGILHVGYITDITNMDTFVNIQTLNITNTTYTVANSEYTVSFPTTVPTDARIAIKNPGLTTAEHYWDDVYWEVAPACLPPVSLTAINVTQSTADLSWSSNGTLFDIEYGSSGFTPGMGTMETDITSNTFPISGLTPSTSYEYYVRQDCGGGDESTWTGPYSFTTTQIPAVLSYNQDFEGSHNWILSNGTQTNQWVVGEATSNGGTHSLYISNDNGINNAYTVTNSISVVHAYRDVQIPTDTDNVLLSYDWKAQAEFCCDYIRVWIVPTAFTPIPGVQITDTDSGGFQLGDNQNLQATWVNKWFEIPVTAYAGQVVRLVFEWRNDGSNGDQPGAAIDNIEISVVTCHAPTGITAANITQTTVDLSWQSDGTLFDIEYGPFDFSLGTGTTIAGITTNPYILTGLDPATSYQYYVRRNCGTTDGYSAWTGPFGFKTLCIAVDTITEDFDNTTIAGFIVPDCWDRIIFNSGIQSVTNNWGPAASGTYHIRQQSFTPSDATIVVLPLISNINTGTHLLRLKARVDTGIGLLQVGYITDITDASTFTEVMQLNITNMTYTSDDAEYVVIFPSSTPSNARIAVRNPGASGVEHYWDDVHWEIAPACMYPLGLSSSNISNSSTVLSWINNGTLFDIEYGPAGFTPGSADGTVISGVGNSFILSGLTAGVDYDYYVRQDCGVDNGVSNWRGPFEFAAGAYAGTIPTMLNANPQVDDIACATSFSIDVPDGQYLSALNVQYQILSVSPYWTSQQRSALYSPTLGMGEPEVVAGETDFPGFIPYNRDVTFANGATGTIEFELKAWRTDGGTGCSTAQVYVMDGSWILTPSFLPIPTCPDPPTDLGYTNITETSVDLIWTADEDGTFQIHWGTVDFDPETEGTAISGITTNSYTLSGLDSSIPYEFYVRRDCSTDDEEDYGDRVGPFRFNSGYCIPYVGIVHYFTQFHTTNALENVTLTPVEEQSYVNNTAMVISQQAEESFNFTSHYIGGPSGLRIWMDRNNNFVFEDDEEVFFLAGSNGSKSGIITIPAGTEPGNYRMRVRGQAGTASVPPACGGTDYGQTIDFTLNIPCDEVDAPVGDTPQEFTEGDTLAYLDVTGDNLVWYADQDLTVVLEDTTLLVHETTYYVVSTDGNCQSEALAVFVEELLSTSDFTGYGFGYYPNPVSEVLYLRANTEIGKVSVFNMLGQQLNLPVEPDNTQIDMSGLPSGNYVLSVTVEGITKTFKIVK